jgi:putative MATE family efflux protein
MFLVAPRSIRYPAGMQEKVILNESATAHQKGMWGAEVLAMVALALPIVGANLLQMGVYAIDVMFVARLGTVEFAAATLGVFLMSLVLWGLIGLTGACAPIIAAELGSKSHAVRQVRRSFRMAIWLSILASLPFMLLLANGEVILRFCGQDAKVAERAGAFLDILLFALIPAVATGVCRNVVSALGRPRWALGITAIALLIGIAGNWLLVFGNGGFPALGLEGSAIASVVTSVITLAAYGVVFMRDRHLRRYHLLGRWWRAEWSRFWEIVRIGAPIALGWTMEGALFGGASVLMGLIGVTEVAAHAVALNIAALAFQVPLGVAQAATIRVGLAYGGRDAGRIARAGWVAIFIGTGFMVSTALLIWTVPRPLIGVYLDTSAPANAHTVALALQYLTIAAMFQLFDGAQVVGAGALRGLQDTRVPMLFAGFGYWVAGFGTALVLGFRTPLAGQGIWIGLATGLAVVSALMLRRWSRRELLGLVPE